MDRSRTSVPAGFLNTLRFESTRTKLFRHAHPSTVVPQLRLTLDLNPESMIFMLTPMLMPMLPSTKTRHKTDLPLGERQLGVVRRRIAEQRSRLLLARYRGRRLSAQRSQTRKRVGTDRRTESAEGAGRKKARVSAQLLDSLDHRNGPQTRPTHSNQETAMR